MRVGRHPKVYKRGGIFRSSVTHEPPFLRAADARRTRARIIAAAARQFLACGYTAATMRAVAIDTVWALMDPALFCRLTGDRGWTAARFGRWFADSVQRLLLPAPGQPAANHSPEVT